MTTGVLRVGAHEERALVQERVSQIKSELEAGDYARAIQSLRSAVRVPQDPADVRRFAALMTRVPLDAFPWRRTCRIAILSAATSGDRAAILRLSLAADLIGVELYEGPFG